MYRGVLLLSLLLATVNGCPTEPPLKPSTVPMSEVSGAVNIGNDRVMLIADEGYQVQVVSSAEATFKAGDAKSFSANMKPPGPFADGAKGKVDDIEDVTWDDKAEAAFLITSHSRSKKQDAVVDARAEKPQRHKLVRISLKQNSNPDGKVIDVLDAALQKFPFVSEAMKRPHQDGGNAGTFNIEGLAFDQRSGFLLLGLRSPTQVCDGKPCAVVLTLQNPHELFDNPAALPKFDPRPGYLDLGGLGIRGMTYDAREKGFWILAGRSADPDTPSDQVLPSLWFWDSAKPEKPPQRITTDLLGLSLEGVCLLNRDGKPGLLLFSDDGGDSAESRYLWIPKPKVSSSN